MCAFLNSCHRFLSVVTTQIHSPAFPAHSQLHGELNVQSFIQPGAPNTPFPSSVEVLTCWSERNAYFALNTADGHNMALSPLDHGREKCWQETKKSNSLTIIAFESVCFQSSASEKPQWVHDKILVQGRGWARHGAWDTCNWNWGIPIIRWLVANEVAQRPYSCYGEENLLSPATSASLEFLQLTPSSLNLLYNQGSLLGKLTASPWTQTPFLQDFIRADRPAKVPSRLKSGGVLSKVSSLILYLPYSHTHISTSYVPIEQNSPPLILYSTKYN